MQVLLADDEQLVLDVLRDIVESLGCNVVTAGDGSRALQLLHTVNVDLAILDVNMPGMTGLEVLSALKGAEDAPLVVILTADPSVEGAAQAVRDGAFEYLMKPVHMQNVSNTLERARRVIALRRENRRYRERLEQLVAEKTAEIRKKNEELERTCDHLSRALESAKRSSRLASLGELASGMAHEIRNPLSSISLAAGNLAMEMKDNPDAQECVGDIRRVVDHLSRTVEHILSFARPPKPTLKRGNLAMVVERALSLSRNYAKKNQIEIVTDFEENMPETHLDESQIEQILVNLIINATRAMGDDGGRLTLRTWVEGRRVCASVSDTGPGVPADRREQIFAPFFSRFDSGTGLGLSISRNLAESHGGDLRVGDAPDGSGGAHFILILPLLETAIEGHSNRQR